MVLVGSTHLHPLDGLLSPLFEIKMKLFKWLCFLPINLLMGLLVIPLAPIAVAFFSTEDKRHLTRFKWLETIDNDLTGDKDEGWRQTHLIGDDPYTWLNRTRWLWRNGGNSVNYNLLGCVYANTFQIDDYLWLNADGYWLYRRPIWITKKRFIDFYIGWQILGPKLGKCKFVCTIRLKTKP